MCGFVVIASLNGQSIPEEALKKGAEAIAHRGPDDEQILIRSNIGIAFRRLSINDLDKGVQPLWNENKSCALVCNGEIYNSPSLKKELELGNHHFKTGSDCEVILPLYEASPSDFVTKLEGMFALSIIDFEKSKLTFARDRFGIKPLYFYQDKSWVIVASEIKALLATGLVPKEINSRFVYDSFTFGHALDQQTIVKNVNAISPASITYINLKEPKALVEREYWHPSFPERKAALDILGGRQAEHDVRQYLSQAVESHLLSDVPVAAYLSGGLDSTITSLLMKQFLPSQLTTFSIGFEDSEFDESKIFHQTNSFGGFNGIEIRAIASDINLFRETIRTIEMPQFSPMDIPLIKLSARVKSEGIKVVLSGEGSDELFGGYSVFPWIHIATALNLPSMRPLREIMSHKALRLIGIPDEGHPIFNDVFSDESLAIERELGFFPPWLPIWRRRLQGAASLFSEPEKLFIKRHPALLAIGDKLKKDYPKIDKFDAGLYVEIKTRLPNYILNRTDRTSMKNSVEARVPFLDKAFSESALACSPLLKTFGFREKSVLRKAFKDILPPHFKSLRKFGYTAPNKWCWAPEATALQEQYLSNTTLEQTGIFNTKEIQSRINAVKAAAQNNKWSLERMEDSSFLIGIMSLQVLFDEFFRS